MLHPNYHSRSKLSTSLGEPFHNQDFASEQRALLDLIAKLEFAQLEDVSLPRIAVVGSQSAGKSSVLEAISGISFPKDKGACTRFAIEIRMRRSNNIIFKVYINPDKTTRSFTEQKVLEDFGGDVSESKPFHTLMEEAAELIAPKNIPGRFAAKDVLIIEKSGPELPHLTLVDLPGLVSNENNEQNQNDLDAIESLMDRYMKSKRTIVLTVVGGNEDYVQAPILKKTRKFDPHGRRSIGVLTKPDVIHTATGLEDNFLALVRNEDKINNFKLGWYVLRNPGRSADGVELRLSEDDRKYFEQEFFSLGKWSTLPKDMCGVAALKQKLSVQLHRHIARHIPSLQKQIEQAKKSCKTELAKLGVGKDTPEEMKEEMVERWSNSDKSVDAAIHGDGAYRNPLNVKIFSGEWSNKTTQAQYLRARAVDENEKFAEILRIKGRKITFSADDDTDESHGRATRDGKMSKSQFAREVVEPLLKQRRGTELTGDNEPRFVYTLFQEYSENWHDLSIEHTEALVTICREFLGQIIHATWLPRMHKPLKKYHLQRKIQEMKMNAEKEIELLNRDRSFEIQAYDPTYLRRLQEWRKEAPDGETSHTVAEEFVEKMLIYYEVSRVVQNCCSSRSCANVLVICGNLHSKCHHPSRRASSPPGTC
jgi:GTPase SAR1 family protein